jgi:hypothetical protein
MSMSEHKMHPNHSHRHQPGCGHKAVSHEGHTDYLHEGHLHHVQGDQVEECVIAVSTRNPSTCTPSHECAGHDRGHRHGPGCGHDAVPHGDHTDYLVERHLHHPHSGHCDDHGVL